MLLTVYGSANITVSATNGTDTVTDTFTVTVNPVPDAPVANNDDSYSIAEETTLEVEAASGVLENDSDADEDPLTATLVTGPAHGSLTLNDDGSFSYTPELNYFGADHFYLYGE